MENKGVEFVLNTQNIKSEFTWNTSFNFSANRNKVLNLAGDTIADMGRGNNWVLEGEPIGVFVGYNFLGIDPTTGKEVYEDIKKDGIITADDRKITGNPNPDFTLGMSNTFAYKGFDFSFFLHAVLGNDVYNGTWMYLQAPTELDQQTTEVLRAWKNPGDITDIPKLADGLKSSRFIENGSFLRIKNVTFGYTLPKDLLKKLWLKSARVYVSGQNLYTFTTYTGMDPEVNYFSTDNIIMGTDFFTYPQSRTILVGLNLGF
jgi:hypothetical protein